MLPQFPALDANWRETLRAQPRSVVFCWAAWSTPDKMFVPILSRVVPYYAAQFAFFTADVDEDSLLPIFTKIMEHWFFTTPMLMMFEGETAIKQTIGYANEDALRAHFDAWLQA